eukprot:jgi/Mesvir1/13127/Mv06100-RA.1
MASFVTFLHVSKKSAEGKQKKKLASDDRTLSVTGLPAGYSKGAVSRVFSSIAPVESVVISSRDASEGGAAEAAVTFKDTDGSRTVLACSAEQCPTVESALERAASGADGGGGGFGLKSWIAQHRAARPGASVLQAQVDDFMDKYERAEKQAEADRLAQAAADDGWTLVTSKKGQKRSRDAAGTTVGVAAPSKLLKTKKAAQLTDFYRFQARENRRNELLEMRKQFEEDKKKVAALKAARKFRPE